MSWPTPQFSKSQVNKAGGILVGDAASPVELSWAQGVLGNWRACHGYPINTFQATLRLRLKHIDGTAFVAQRLKRTPSIISKLKRFSSMHLARMQDIGGLRAVVGTLDRLRVLEKEYVASGRFKHELVNTKDYIAEPKSDGYRSVHLVYRYKNDLAAEYDGLLLELQLRTRLQHAWATAVETMGTFLGQALKARQGEQRWLEFFEITGSAFAHLERCAPIPGYESLTKRETFQRVATEEARLGVLSKLRGFALAVGAIVQQRGAGSYHLVVLDTDHKRVTVAPYPVSRLNEAVAAYGEVERRVDAGEPLEAVLVSAGPIESLRRAYPNYFLDTHDFIRRVERIIALGRDGAPIKRTPRPGPAQARRPRN